MSNAPTKPQAPQVAPPSGSPSSTKDLKRVLGFWDLMGQAVGQIIGAGIMSLTGIAIAMTGRSVPLSFILSALLVLLGAIPNILIHGTARFRGGSYSVVGTLLGKRYSGFYSVIFILANITLAMYALSFADYATPILPGIDKRVLAIAILTILYILNFFGINVMAKVQNLIVLVLVVALGAFSAFGMGHMSADYFSDSFLTNGLLGLMQAAALLTFATGGAGTIANLAGEAKNPTRDIPRVIIVATILVAILYAVMATVAAGVLPVAEVAGKSLTSVAKTIFPTWLYIFFIVGGAWFALITTLNAQMGWATKPIMQACEDGWYSKKLAYLHPTYKTPLILLSILYVLGILPVIFSLDISIISKITNIVSAALSIMIALSLLGLPKYIPELWEKSRFHVSRGWLYVFIVVAILISLMQTVLLAMTMPTMILFWSLVVLALALLYAILRYRYGKVNVQTSYEAR